MGKMKDLKKNILYNYDLDLHLDPYKVIWITHKDLRIDIQHIKDRYYVGFWGTYEDKKVQEHIVVDCDESIMYLLYKYCKDVHKWGEFNNLN